MTLWENFNTMKQDILTFFCAIHWYKCCSILPQATNVEVEYTEQLHFDGTLPLSPCSSETMKNFSYLGGKPRAEANWANCYTSGDAPTFKQDNKEVPADTPHKQYMEAITPAGKYFFTKLSCYSTRSGERLSDKRHGPNDITHQSESSHSHACTTATPVKV